MRSQSSPAVRFGVFELDLRTRELRKHGVKIKLQHQPFAILEMLVERPGEVVSREQIRNKLWPDTHVDYERGLNAALARLRQAIGDSADNPRFLETLPRVGYRFIGAVDGAELPANAVSSPQRLQQDPRETWDSSTDVKSGLGDLERDYDTRSAELMRGRAGSRPITPLASVSEVAPRRIRMPLGSRLIMGLAAAALLGALAVAISWSSRRAEVEESELAYRSGMDLLRQRTLPSVKRGAVELRRAIELRQKFARGWAGLAEAAAFLNPEDSKTCVEFAERAVQLEPTCGECEAVLGFVQFTRQWKWNEAGERLKRAAALKPEDPQIQYWFAQWEIARGHTSEGLDIIDAALRRTPQGLNLLVIRAACLYFSRDFKGAVEAADKAIAVNLVHGWHWRAKALFLLRNYPEALRSLAFDLGSWSTRSPEAVSQRADAYVERYYQAGLEGTLGDLLKTTSRNGPIVHSENRARWHVLLGKPDLALEELEVAVRARVFDVIYLRVDPVFDPLRAHPTFQGLLKTIGLEP